MTNIVSHKRYKYNVINKNGIEEDFTGKFDTKEEAEKWYNKYGKWFEERLKHKFILVEYMTTF